MKPIVFLFTSLLMMLVPITEIKADGGDDPITIYLEDGGTNDYGPMFRDPTIIPISAAFCTTPSVIEVQFLMDLGYVSVEIENQTTSEYTQTVANSAAGLAIFPISGNPGLWTITFSLSNGTVYYGEFNL